LQPRSKFVHRIQAIRVGVTGKRMRDERFASSIIPVFCIGDTLLR
jgi:hypothetical protein